MRIVMDHERAQRRRIKDVSAQNLGYDVRSLDPGSGDLRLIEVKGLAAVTGTILLTPNRAPRRRGPAGRLLVYVVTDWPAGAGSPGTDPRPGPVPVARGHGGAALLFTC